MTDCLGGGDDERKGEVWNDFKVSCFLSKKFLKGKKN